MSGVEAALLLAALPAALRLFWPRARRPRWAGAFAAIALTIAVAAAAFGAYRWQLGPAYLAVAALAATFARDRFAAAATARASKIRQAARVCAAALMLALLSASAVLTIGFPLLEWPQPSGAYAVGVAHARVEDASRPEIFSDDPHDHRSLLLQFWYPARAPDVSARSEPLWGGAVSASSLAQSMRLPRFAFSHVERIATHSYPDAELSDAQQTFPVILYSHGYSQGFVAQNTLLMEELASHGYVVVSIGRPYESSVVRFPDGEVIALSESRMQQARAELAATSDLIARIEASASGPQRAALVRKLIADSPLFRESLEVWTADMRFVLDWLEQLDADGPAGRFAGRLDLARIGALGMSFGGAVAGQTCLREARVKAGVNLDGLQYGDLLEEPLRAPFMFVNSEGASRLNQPMYERAAGPAYLLTVRGARHFDFTDFAVVAPILRHLGALGATPGERISTIYNAYTLAFFEQHLLGRHAALLSGPSAQFPEVDFRRR